MICSLTGENMMICWDVPSNKTTHADRRLISTKTTHSSKDKHRRSLFFFFFLAVALLAWKRPVYSRPAVEASRAVECQSRPAEKGSIYCYFGSHASRRAQAAPVLHYLPFFSRIKRCSSSRVLTATWLPSSRVRGRASCRCAERSTIP